ncbi:MAG: hypothetical protein JWN14_4806 [Chthonomonadales bacterium]|nr:hypothetical protein [Chthonomonadales bacterium]
MNTNSTHTNSHSTTPAVRLTRRLALVGTLLLIGLMAGQTSSAIAQSRPTITGFTPASGPVGTVVTINGTNFNRDKNGAVWSGTTPPYQAVFPMSGDVAFSPVTFVSATQIRTTVPAGAVTAPISLRQGFTNITTSAVNFTVTAPQAVNGTLRVTNNTQYDVVSLKINGQEKIQSGASLAVGLTGTIALTPGTYNLVAGIGFVNSNGSRDIWFTIPRTANITGAQTTTTTFVPMTIAQLLTLGATFTDWLGEFFDNNGGFHLARLRFLSNGTWQLFKDNVLQSSGSTTLVSWPAHSTTVQFRISATQPVITIGFPFAGFFFRNGPPNFPIIQYTRQ